MNPALVILRKVGRREWELEMPRINEEVDDRLEEGIDWMLAGNQRKAQAIFKKLIKEYPEHIDGYHHLALSLEKAGETAQALKTWKLAVTLALQFFPAHFDFHTQRLTWGWMENRPFLRALHGLGYALLKNGQPEAAVKILERILKLNPNDNQGARGNLVNCYFELKLPREVLKLCQRHPQDALEQLVYGKALANFQTGAIQKAETALKTALKAYPLIAAELSRERHRKPRNLNEERITMGGKDQAYLYWKEAGKHWEETPGALPWLKERLKAKT